MNFCKWTFLYLAVVLPSFGYTAESSPAHSVDLWIPSRDTNVPITLVSPAQVADAKVPLVVLIHGHGGTRHEAGGYTRVAEALAAAGIASVRMDFPGCGDSRESFEHNNLTNMMADIQAAQRYALSQRDIDSHRIGLLGFSMGGRLAITLAADDPQYKALGLWAPAATDGAGNMQKYLGGEARYMEMKAQAKQEGFAPFTTFWGQQQKLGYQWFTDMEQSTPGVSIGQYQGDLFVLYGDQDTVVVPAVSEAVIRLATQAESITKHVISGADHGLGLFTDEWDKSQQAVEQSVKFFAEKL